MPQRDTYLVHSRFGNLGAVDAVVMDCSDSLRYPLHQDKTPYIHLSVTGRCHARCQGCVNSAITSSYNGDRRDIVPIQDTVPERDAACIAYLVREMGPGPVVICLYGGEPLLATDKIAVVRELIGRAGLANPIRYMIYTNGDLLHKAVREYPELMADIWLYSVSIDGRDEQHNRIRCGTKLARIHEGLAALRELRRGTVLMWSTLREEQSLLDCYEEFMGLYQEGMADQFFWHWIEAQEPIKDLAAYAGRYENDLTAIMDVYLHHLKQGKILPFVHINELVIYLLNGCRRSASACGVELAENFDLIDGRIHACADLPLDLAIGEIDEAGRPYIRSRDLGFLVDYKLDLGCHTCAVHGYCGGRCPVQAYSGGLVRMAQYCQLMRLHIGMVKEHVGRITEAMAGNNITVQDLYDASAYFAQFTDVTP